MDHKIYSNRGDRELHGEQGRGQEVRREANSKKKDRLCNYISLRTRRAIKLIMDIAELELLWSAAYIAMVIGSTSDMRQQIADRIPQIRTGIIWMVIGAAVWTIAHKTEQYMKKRIKK